MRACLLSRSALRRGLAALSALLILVVVWQLILQPDPRDDLRAADRLFLTGRYHAALAAYLPLAETLPAAQLRVGMLRTVRGEADPAERALRGAMERGLAPADYHLALLYLGQSLASDGRTALAADTWRLLEDCRSPAACAYRGPGRLLAGEMALFQGDYPAAARAYRAALAAPLAPEWSAVARYRLALLGAPAPDAPLPSATGPLLIDPLRPAISGEPEQFAALHELPVAQQAQAFGQFYLSLGLYNLAEAQFARVEPVGPEARSAAAYAAYTRWRAGDAQGGLERLEALVAAQPADPQARTLLALAYLTVNRGEAAAAAIDAVARLTPAAADVQLAWASWYAAQRDYAAAAEAYGQAVLLAQPAERGRYALLGAQFHLSTTYALCDAGLPLAEAAAAASPANSAALTTLAASRYACAQFAPAVEAARAAQVAGAGADAAYYLGAALAALGEREGARKHLIAAADLAPASLWRERAELMLEYLH
jgi:hypothetical protein